MFEFSIAWAKAFLRARLKITRIVEAGFVSQYMVPTVFGARVESECNGTRLLGVEARVGIIWVDSMVVNNYNSILGHIILSEGWSNTLTNMAREEIMAKE